MSAYCLLTTSAGQKGNSNRSSHASTMPWGHGKMTGPKWYHLVMVMWHAYIYIYCFIFLVSNTRSAMCWKKHVFFSNVYVYIMIYYIYSKLRCISIAYTVFIHIFIIKNNITPNTKRKTPRCFFRFSPSFFPLFFCHPPPKKKKRAPKKSTQQTAPKPTEVFTHWAFLSLPFRLLVRSGSSK